MSIRLMNTAWGMQLQTGRKFVLVALADQANDLGECFPSIATIARRCSMSQRAVQQHISGLEKDGFILRDIRAGRSTVYRLVIDTTPAESAPQSSKTVSKKIVSVEANKDAASSPSESTNPSNICTPAESAPPQNLHP